MPGLLAQRSKSTCPPLARRRRHQAKKVPRRCARRLGRCPQPIRQAWPRYPAQIPLPPRRCGCRCLRRLLPDGIVREALQTQQTENQSRPLRLDRSSCPPPLRKPLQDWQAQAHQRLRCLRRLRRRRLKRCRLRRHLYPHSRDGGQLGKQCRLPRCQIRLPRRWRPWVLRQHML